MDTLALPKRTTTADTSTRTYLVLVGVLVICRLLFALRPAVAAAQQQFYFEWPMLILAVVAGWLGFKSAPAYGLPDFWDQSVSQWQRFGIPILLGLGTGALTILQDVLQPMPPLHVPWPDSIPFYLYGGLWIELMARLGLIPCLMWLIGGILFRGKWNDRVFWGVAILTSLVEPLSQLTAYGALGVSLLGAGEMFLFEMVKAYLFKRAGFLAPLSMRLSHYLIWHIVWGGFRVAGG